METRSKAPCRLHRFPAFGFKGEGLEPETQLEPVLVLASVSDCGPDAWLEERTLELSPFQAQEAINVIHQRPLRQVRFQMLGIWALG